MKDRFESLSYSDSFRTESDLLRNDSKNLLKTLKQHQNVINNSFNKLKQADTVSNDRYYNNEYNKINNGTNSIKYSTEILNILNNSIRDFSEKHKVYANDEVIDTKKAHTYKPPSYYSNFLKTFPMTSMSSINFNYDSNHTNSITSANSLRRSKSRDSLKDSSQNNKSKTVSFSDYLRTFSTSTTSLSANSPRHRLSRSASPYTPAKSPKKSILKKQIVEDEMSDYEDENKYDLRKSTSYSNLLSSSSESLSTNSLLSMNINNKLNLNDDFNDYCRKYSTVKKDILLENNYSNDDSFLEFIAKKRQSLLNHKYNDDSTSNFNELSLNENQDKYKKDFIKKKSSKKNNLISKKEISNKCIKRPINYKRSVSVENVQSSEENTSSTLNKDSKSNKNSTINLTRQQIIADKKNAAKMKQYKKMAKNVKKDRPLLGCDWAMDALDTKLNTTQTKFEKPEEYWRELNSFRNENKDECISNKLVNFDGTLANIHDLDSFNLTNQSLANNLTLNHNNNLENGIEDDGRNHRCIHSYKLNDRLFPVPIYKDNLGRSLCPVCKTPRKEGNFYAPQFCKVSIPKSKILDLHHNIDFNKRKNSYPEDSLSLADNCSPGYASKRSNIFKLPVSKTLDLKTAAGIKNKSTELTLNDLKRISTNRDPATSSVYNKANAMRYELEDNHLKELRRIKESISKI